MLTPTRSSGDRYSGNRPSSQYQPDRQSDKAVVTPPRRARDVQEAAYMYVRADEKWLGNTGGLSADRWNMAIAKGLCRSPVRIPAFKLHRNFC